jgi:hypothetical protein
MLCVYFGISSIYNIYNVRNNVQHVGQVITMFYQFVIIINISVFIYGLFVGR